MSKEKYITKDELFELERKIRTRHEIILDYLICILPIIFGIFVILHYKYYPSIPNADTTNVYSTFIGILVCALFVLFLIGSKNKIVFSYLRNNAPLFSIIFVGFLIYDYLTLKTGVLILPFFPWPDKVLSAMVNDRIMLLDCVLNSLCLLFTGYFIGSIIGVLTGITAGWSKEVNYWVSPIMKILGPIPSTTWLPLIMALATSLYKGSVFVIILGVWYPVTLASMTGIQSVRKSFYEAAQTLGSNKWQLIFKVAIPYAMPNIFQGLTQGMSVACSALLVAEMMGVRSGLGWYITWQKSWGEFSKMYAAIIMICITFTIVNFIFNIVKKRVLRWQEGMVKCA